MCTDMCMSHATRLAVCTLKREYTDIERKSHERYVARESDSEEGTGTRPDDLANRADQKNEGPLVKKIARISRNSR